MKKAVCIFAFVLAAVTCRARTITVDDNAPADFNNIQAAIDDANDGDTVEIQPGTYTGFGNRDIDFLGKAITVRSTAPTNPEAVARTIIDCNNFGRAFLFQSGEDANSILDGLTIINGYSSGNGGAMYCDRASPTIRNCTMIKNTSGWGGAIRCEDGSSTVIEKCLFVNNSAEGAGAIYYMQSSGRIAECIFRYNYSTWNRAGAVRIREGNVTISDCIFQGNCAFLGDDLYGGWGGALATAECQVSVTNCLFAGNSATEGGAVFTRASELIVEDCTFAHNRALVGNTLHSDTSGYPSPSDIHIENSIIWDGPDSILEHDSTLLVAFCDIPGGRTGIRQY